MDAIFLYLPVFLLVLVRMASFFLTAPIFSTRGIPNQVKIGLAVLLALISFSYVPVKHTIPMDLLFIVYAVKEALIGLLLGLVCEMVFHTIQIAGGLMDLQMGFAMANIIDPRTGVYVPITGTFKSILATLYFLSINGHHMLIRGMLASYQAVPVDRLWIPLGDEKVFLHVLKVFSNMFAGALLMAAPIVAALFLVDLSLGIIAKTVPQFNIFVVGLPIKMIASFLMLIVVMPAFFLILSGLFDQMFQAMAKMMTLLGGSS
ncbi:flagellar type III secretion system protein FliR [Brevibacillus sp. SYP-B805]|uniref:flagellar biosynthetic protein FliR n=1 Tax=Brevibacillus sp. SYP-B805 TaxID=1578199 RepID=UPI0013EB7AB3|nr:flagellar biosynthetic protein FliR [Brevibacillus sp. SYP-B805]NGQ94022.1 flagellar type III secretion system protein FliR [Brevibacillus sp. SYP-B805]